MKLYLKFYDFSVLIKADNSEIIALLRKDFSYFVGDSCEKVTVSLNINAFLNKEIPLSQIPEKVATFQNSKAVTYDYNEVRYVNYHDELLSISKPKECKLYSNTIEKLHEVTYLFILSRMGKFFDLKGLHRIHAFGVKIEETVIIGSIEMGGGKSTLLGELISDPLVQIVSDDSPLIDTLGRVHSFPIRIGCKDNTKINIKNRDENLYQMRREQYGVKFLISLSGIENRIMDDYDRSIYILCRRANHKKSQLKKISKIKALSSLIGPMIIGLGLPIIFEYFWEKGITDFFRKSKIAILRTISAAFYILKSESFQFEMGPNIEDNAEILKELSRK